MDKIYAVLMAILLFIFCFLMKKGFILKYQNISFRKDYFNDICETFFDELKGKLQEN